VLHIYDISNLKVNNLTLIVLTWRKWWAPNNASKWQMGFNSGFKGLNSTNVSLRIQKLILAFSTSQLVLSNNFDYSKAFDIVSHTFLLYWCLWALCSSDWFRSYWS